MPEPLTTVDPTDTRQLTLTIAQLRTLGDALFGGPVDRATAHSIQSVLWAAQWDEHNDA